MRRSDAIAWVLAAALTLAFLAACDALTGHVARWLEAFEAAVGDGE